LTGYNTNITYKGAVYHAQTEDSGPKNLVITTLLYYKGAILASKKTTYGHLFGEADWQEKVERIMKTQHHSMIKDLLSGKYTGDAPPPEPEAKEPVAVETEKGLDDILLDYIISRQGR